MLGPLLLSIVLQAPLQATFTGQVIMTVPEALELAFPEAEVERTRAFLSAEEEQRVGELSKRKYTGRTVIPYVARVDGKIIGTAYFDTHKVRTKRETVMVVVGPDGKVQRTELLAFAEPRDYIPNSRWYAQFPKQKLCDDLELKRGIKGVTGATMTARATMGWIRKALALHQVLASRKDAK